ncbi:MAG: CGNR zinc finger domain-containing protein [Mycobacteriales bacterium]
MVRNQPGTPPQVQPDAVALVLHYANEQATDATWRGIVLGPGVAFEGHPKDATPFGVQSLEAYLAIQADLKTFLDRVLALDSAYAEDARKVAEDITNEARLKFGGWAFSPVNERLFELWDTETTSFRELVFSTLARALRAISFRDLHRCKTCGKFFVDASKRKRKFCSNTCRSRMTVRRHRERTASTEAPETMRSEHSRKPSQAPKRGPRR